jgi:hypothetical protein
MRQTAFVFVLCSALCLSSFSLVARTRPVHSPPAKVKVKKIKVKARKFPKRSKARVHRNLSN